MIIQEWYDNPKQFNGNNLDAWILACEVITNIYISEKGTLEDKIKCFEKSKTKLKKIYETYKISDSIKFENQLFLDEFEEKNIHSHSKTNLEKHFEKLRLQENISYDEKLKIWSDRHEKGRRKSLAEILQGVKICSSENDF